MLLNYSAPRLAPNIVTPPKSNVDVNSILGLKASDYEGLQSVGDTGYFYGDNKMYEAYKPSPTYFYKSGPFGTQYYNNQTPYGISSSPSYSPIFGYSGGWQRGGGADAGTIYKGEQAFRPLDIDVTGFTKTKPEGSDIYEYAPSMAYVYSQAPKYQGNPQLASSPAINLTTPTANVYNGNYGAGRFLNTGNLLGFNFGTPSGQTAGGQTTT